MEFVSSVLVATYATLKGVAIGVALAAAASSLSARR